MRFPFFTKRSEALGWDLNSLPVAYVLDHSYWRRLTKAPTAHHFALSHSAVAGLTGLV